MTVLIQMSYIFLWNVYNTKLKNNDKQVFEEKKGNHILQTKSEDLVGLGAWRTTESGFHSFCLLDWNISDLPLKNGWSEWKGKNQESAAAPPDQQAQGKTKNASTQHLWMVIRNLCDRPGSFRFNFRGRIDSPFIICLCWCWRGSEMNHEL